MSAKVRHIAKTGKLKGQWVACNAQIRCQNGGVHVDTKDLYRARDLLLKDYGKNYTAISKIPLDYLKHVLTAGEIRPNNLPAQNVPTVTVVRKPKPTAPVVKKIPKHFNDGSSFVDLLQTVYGKNDYSVVYPVQRVISFDSVSSEEFKETVAYLNQLPTYDRKLFYNISKSSIIVRLNDDEAVRRWAPAEVHNIISWFRVEAEKSGKQKSFDEYFEYKNEFLTYVKSLGISAVID